MDDGFLRAILARPDDNLPRLVYADYLDERGDPRGEFIRVQIALSQNNLDPELKQRERDLFTEYGERWLGPLSDFVSVATFRRGFVEEVVVVADQYLRNEARLFSTEPVRRIKFRGIFGQERALAHSTGLTRLVGIDFGYNELDAGQLLPLINSSEIARVQDLTIAGNLVGDRGALAVASATHLSHLRHLDVEGCKITHEGMARLQAAPHLRRLESFTCFDNPIGNAGARIVREMDMADRLRVLDLSNTGMDDDGLGSLDLRPWPSLFRLDVGFNRLQGTSLGTFGRSNHFPRLSYVGLHGNPIAEATIERFLQTSLGRRLTSFGYSLDTASDGLAARLRERFGDGVY